MQRGFMHSGAAVKLPLKFVVLNFRFSLAYSICQIFFKQLVSSYFRELVNVTICQWIKAPVV
jgi:hypothetical protein